MDDYVCIYDMDKNIEKDIDEKKGPLSLNKLVEISNKVKLQEEKDEEQKILEFKQEVKNDFINEVQKKGSNFKFPFTYDVPEPKIPIREDIIGTVVKKAIEETIIPDETYNVIIYPYNSFYNANNDKYTDRNITINFKKL